MIILPKDVQVYVCTQPTDMRKSFDSLAALVGELIQQNPLSGHLFVFVSKSKKMLKILFWDRTGYSQYYKRLENGTFSIAHCSLGQHQQGSVLIDSSELQLVLDGIDLFSHSR